jgi:hypothetical protein
MKTDEQIVDRAFKKATKLLNLCVTYETQVDKLMFIRAFKALSTLYGDDAELMGHWMNTYNNHLKIIPSQMIEYEDYLYVITNYLENFSTR